MFIIFCDYNPIFFGATSNYNQPYKHIWEQNVFLS